MAQPRSSYIQLYDDEEDPSSDYKWQIENKQAGVSIKDSNNVRPMKFYAKKFSFYEGGATPGPEFDLKARMSAADAAAASAQTKADTAASDLATETASRIAGDSGLQTAVDAESARAGAAESVNAAAVVTEQARALAAEAVVQASVAAEAASRIAADNTESARALGVEASLQSQISNVLQNSDTTALNSLSEIVASFQGADVVLTGGVADLLARMIVVEARLDTLLE